MNEERQDPQKTASQLLERKQLLGRQIRRRIKMSQRLLKTLEQQLDEAKNWKRLEHEATILKSHLYQIPKKSREAVLIDWETGEEVQYQFNKTLPDEVSFRFKKARKLQRSVEPLDNRIKQVTEWINALSVSLEKLERTESLEEVVAIAAELKIDPPKKPLKKELKPPPLPYKEYLSEKGVAIWVGKSAKDNDKLTFTHARGSDMWLHVSDYGGSHVVIRSTDPDEATLRQAMELAVKNSRARDVGKVEVTITQVKYVTKYRGSKPGSVHVSKHTKRVC